MRLLGLDFETTGLDPVEDVITEVGAVLWDTERKCPLLIDNFFVFHPEIDVTEEITQATGIRQTDLEEFGIDSREGFDRLYSMMGRCEAVVAHNGRKFDCRFLQSWANRLGHNSCRQDLTWIDTRDDLDYPDILKTRQLTYLAAEHGFLNPFAHRAVFDVLTMMVVLGNYDLESVLFSAAQPIITIQAMVSFDDRQLAKDKGFHWNPDRKQWLREIKQHRIPSQEFKFHTRTVTAE